MILTGSEIERQVDQGGITIDDFDRGRLNPNSYNYRLGPEIVQVDATGDDRSRLLPQPTVDGRVLLRAQHLYLGHTAERIGSRDFVCSLIGRSSVGRLGLFVQISANLGHRGICHRWTLELLPALDIWVYPGQIIGQVSFWQTYGPVLAYTGWYARHDHPMASRLHPEIKETA